MSQAAALSLAPMCGGLGALSSLFDADKDRRHPILDNSEHPEHPRISFESCWEDEQTDEGYRRDVEEQARALAWRWLGRFVGLLSLYLVEDGRSKVEGAGIRAFVFASFFSPRLRELSQPQLAAVMNRKHKQSVGREMSKFRDFFRGVIRPGLQREAAREVCRKREAIKRDIKFETTDESDFEPVIKHV